VRSRIAPFFICIMMIFPYLPLGLRLEHIVTPLIIIFYLSVRSFKLEFNVIVLVCFLLFSLIPPVLASFF
jgi:hypothetical protein